MKHEYEIVDKSSIPLPVSHGRTAKSPWHSILRDLPLEKAIRVDNENQSILFKLRLDIQGTLRPGRGGITTSTRLVKSENGTGYSLFVWRKEDGE